MHRKPQTFYRKYISLGLALKLYISTKHIFLFFFCQTTHWHSGSLRHAYETAVSKVGMWLSSQKFYSLRETKTSSFLQSFGKWWLVFGSPWKSILLRMAWEGDLWGEDKWVEYTSIQTCFSPSPIFLPPKPHSKWDTAQNSLGYKTGSQHCSLAIGKRSFFPHANLAEQQNPSCCDRRLKRTCRSPWELGGISGRLFCWEERQESSFREPHYRSSARIKE